MASDAATADELAIHRLVARYADAVNRRDEADWAATWAEDGVWELMGSRHEGRAASVAFWNVALDSLKFVVQQVHSGFVELDGDRASGRWNMTELGVSQQGHRSLLSALYHDRYVREAEGWRFSERRLEVLYYGPPDLSGVKV